MNTYTEKAEQYKNRSIANNFSQIQHRRETSFQYVDSRPLAMQLRKLQQTTNNSSQVKQLRSIQAMANNSRHTEQIAQMREAMNSGSVKITQRRAVVQLMSRDRARERIREARQNRRLLLMILTVVAANIINGDFVLEDVDDLLEGEDHEFLVSRVQNESLKAERRAQKQRIRDQQRNLRRQQNNRPKGKGGHR